MQKKHRYPFQKCGVCTKAAHAEGVLDSGCLAAIAGVIRERTGEGGPADISMVMKGINDLLDESIATEGFRIREPGLVKKGDMRPGVIDLSNIDFKLLAKNFKDSKKKNVELEALKAAIRAQLERMIRLNRFRTDYLTKFEELIDAYNAGSRNIDELFRELLELSRALNEEQQRHVRENLNEEELVIFDILTRPGPELSSDEREAIKIVAKDLLQRLKDLLVLDWRRNVQTRARVHEAIAEVLDHSLPRAYTPEIYKRKCSAVFEHIYESYSDDRASVYY